MLALDVILELEFGLYASLHPRTGYPRFRELKQAPQYKRLMCF
jgi:hypothetical protein